MIPRQTSLTLPKASKIYDENNESQTRRSAEQIIRILHERLNYTEQRLDILEPVVNNQTGTTYTFILSDANDIITFNNASPITVTIPSNASVAFPIGTKIKCIRLGAGLITFSPAGGVTLNKPTGIKPNRYMGAMVKKSADQTAANYSSATVVEWDAETRDSDAWHDTVTNNSRLTIPSGLGIKTVDLRGKIRVTDHTANLYTGIFIFKNGTQVYDGTSANLFPSTLTLALVDITALDISCADGDYFQLFLECQTDTSVTVVAAQSTFTIRASSIDAIGTITYQYGEVELLKIATNTWAIYGPGLG